MSKQQVTESQARSLARRHGYRLWKVRERSRHFWEYGPYALIDADTSCIVAWRLTLHDAGKELEAR